jgi:DNA-binding NarL/FixJ family response regulator
MRRIPTYLDAGDPIIRAGLASQLRPRPEVRVVDDGERDQAEVVVADTVTEDAMRGLRAMRCAGILRLIVVAGRIDDADPVALMEVGVAGVVRRSDATADRLVSVITAAAAGEGTVPPDLLGRLLAQVGQLQRQVLGPRGLTFSGLSDREVKVLRLVADGLDTSEIAHRLAYSERTIKNVLHEGDLPATAAQPVASRGVRAAQRADLSGGRRDPRGRRGAAPARQGTGPARHRRRHRLRRTDQGVGGVAPSRLGTLAAAAGLTPLDEDLLLVALVPDVDSRFEQFYGYLNDDVTRRRATVGLALRLCGVPEASAAGRSRLDLDAPLLRAGLLSVEDPERPFLSRTLRVPDRVVAHLLGDDRVIPSRDLAVLVPLLSRFGAFARTATARSRELVDGAGAGGTGAGWTGPHCTPPLRRPWPACVDARQRRRGVRRRARGIRPRGPARPPPPGAGNRLAAASCRGRARQADPGAAGRPQSSPNRRAACTASRRFPTPSLR